MSDTKLIQQFIKELEDKKRSPSTIIAYKKDLQQLTEFLGAKKPLEKATSSDLQGFLDSLIKGGQFTLKTISRKINTLKTFYKFLTQKGSIKDNVALPLKHPEMQAKPQRVLAPLEYKALRDTVRSNKRLYTMVEILLQTGIRIGELSRLKITDIKIDGKKKTLRIESFASNPEREVEVNEQVERAIKGWLSERPAPKNDKGYCFPTKTGNCVLVRNIRTSVNRAFKTVGIKDATVNDLRNTFVVYQLEGGVKVEKIAKMVGHQRLTSTEKYLSLLSTPPKNKLNKLQVL